MIVLHRFIYMTHFDECVNKTLKKQKQNKNKTKNKLLITNIDFSDLFTLSSLKGNATHISKFLHNYMVKVLSDIQSQSW